MTMSTQGTHGPDSPDDLPPEEALAGPPEGGGGARSHGIHVAQFDALDERLRMIAAHGDLLAIAEVGDLAPGTVTAIGQAIHDDARAMREILDQVEAQPSGQAAGGAGRVEEVRAGYVAASLRLVAQRRCGAGPHAPRGAPSLILWGKERISAEGLGIRSLGRSCG